MSEKREKLQRKVLKALFNSTEVTDEDVRWRKYRFNEKRLERQLNALSEKPVSHELVTKLANRYGLVILRADPLKLKIYGFEKAFDRQTIAEGMGAAGVQFFPTRQSASRAAFESGREVAYFGMGSFDSQFFNCPIAQIAHEIDDSVEIPERGTILRDIREEFSSNDSIFKVLTDDKYFNANLRDAEALAVFQKHLRTDPFSSDFVSKCKPFFDRRATIGVRDTMRWALGSRHPWFKWERAQTLISSAFETHQDTNFNTAQIVYYAYDPSLDEIEIEEAQAQNAQVVEQFANYFDNKIRLESVDLADKIHDQLLSMCAWILDIHHDYPDFDLESAGSMGPSTHFDFLGHSIQNSVNHQILGEKSQMRLNLNMRAHFKARGLDTKYLANLNDTETETFFAILHETLIKYDTESEILYKRLPCTLFLIQELGNPEPRENERLLDSFDLSEMTQLEHASYMRSFSEISENLVVFFALTLRHMLETEHVPDLRPRDILKDFLVLGLWGTRTPNIRINLYVDKSQDDSEPVTRLTRCEIRFVGTEQVETHPLDHIREEAKALRVAIAHVSPLIEPSILRNLGTFTMAMEEFQDTTHVFKTDPLSLMRYAMDMSLEAARWGIRGSTTEVLTIVEYVLDYTYDSIQKKLDKTAKFIEKHKGK